MSMIEIIKRLSPLRMAPNSDGLDKCVEELKKELSFDVHEFAGGLEVNGWIVPKKWEVIEAKIKDTSGKVIYDGMAHPLAVIGYSRSYTGRIDKEELKKHLFYSSVLEDALVYHCDLFYKPFREEWGFSVSKRFFDSLEDNQYDVKLKTSFEEGTMKVAEYVLEGETEESIILNAHNCHAFCCNDDLAGVAVGIEVIKRLAQLSNRRYTYRLIIAPEHFGSIFYLDSLSNEETKKLKYGIFLEMLGTKGALALQRSFAGDSLIDRALLNVLEYSQKPWRTEPFRKVVGNDETCWEAVGYEIPFPSLSRSEGKGHYTEYHTSKDSPDIIREESLNEAVDVVMEALFILENDIVMEAQFKGLIALSHPRYNLYKPFWDPSEEGRKDINNMQVKWNYLMDCIPRYFDGKIRALEIAERHQLPFRAVYEYIKEFEEKGLVTAKPAASNVISRKLPPC